MQKKRKAVADWTLKQSEAQVEVLKEREREADWTLKRLGDRLKSKRNEKERWIGR